MAEPGNDWKPSASSPPSADDWATVLRESFAELDDMALSLTDERIDELRDQIIVVARSLLDDNQEPQCGVAGHRCDNWPECSHVLATLERADNQEASE